MQVSPIENKTFGAVITGVKLPVIDETDFAQIKSEFLKYGFLVFPTSFQIFAQVFLNLPKVFFVLIIVPKAFVHCSWVFVCLSLFLYWNSLVFLRFSVAFFPP